MLKVTQLTKETKMKQESFKDYIKLYYSIQVKYLRAAWDKLNVTQSAGVWLGTRTTKKHHGNMNNK